MKNYVADDIKVLSSIEAIRYRPRMYGLTKEYCEQKSDEELKSVLRWVWDDEDKEGHFRGGAVIDLDA